MLLYPIFLRLEGHRVLIVGAGPVAVRKAKGLIEAGAHVVVVAPAGDPEMAELTVAWQHREFESTDLDGADLVFAATNLRSLNRAIGETCRSRGIWANIADSAEECDFQVPARVNCEDVQIAISTGGADPKRASRLRKRFEQILSQACEHDI